MLNGIFSLTSGANYLNPVFAQATSYVSAAYIIELAGRLLVAQCRFPGGGGTGTGVLPTVAWSGEGLYAGSGANDPWNPANSATLNGNIGGYNLLSDVPDTISGLAGMGRSAIIFRLNGLSQSDPNPGNSNSGIQPFNFYHLWTSPQGVGAYPGTVAQYGYTAFFLSGDNAYSMNMSAGPQPIGPKIIPKILADLKKTNFIPVVNNPAGQTVNSAWMFGSVVNMAGQLHYLISLSAYALDPTTSLAAQSFTAIVYDFNVSEAAWHIWDMSQYLNSNGIGQEVIAFTTPIVNVVVAVQGTLITSAPATIPSMVTVPFLAFGGVNSFGTIGSYSVTGLSWQFVPFDYDFNSNPYTSFISPSYYPPISLPQSTLVFRGEVIGIGKRNVQRRLLVQADNAPTPGITLPLPPAAPHQQQATVTFQGSFANSSVSSPLNWSQGSNPTVPYMQGNYAPLGLPIQTYYADLLLTDEMIQASIAATITQPVEPWTSLPMFRISTVMLLLNSPKGSIQ
jgi:hypothetical protein